MVDFGIIMQVALERGNVITGAERYLTGAALHLQAHSIVAHTEYEPVREPLEHPERQGVERGRPVERDRGHSGVHLGEKLADVNAGVERKSTRLNSSHANISYSVFCFTKKKPARSAASTTGQSEAAPQRVHT